MDKQLDGYPIIAFASSGLFESWMEQNHTTSGVWVKIAKKSTGIASVTHDEALDIALCYGWIDGMRRGLDQQYFLQKFTPRRPRSLWSKRNIGKIEGLIVAGRMQPAGQAEIDAAKADGRWDAAYDGPKDMVLPAEFLELLAKSTQAQTAYDALNSSEKYAIYFSLATAKRPETRQRRIEKIIATLETSDS